MSPTTATNAISEPPKPPQAGGQTGTANSGPITNQTKTENSTARVENIKLAQSETAAPTSSETQTTNTAGASIQAPTEEQFSDSIDNFNKKVFFGANIAQVIGNSISFITKFPILSKFKNIGDRLGEITSKAFFLANGVTNAIKQTVRHNYTSALGYMVYIINGLFVPQNKAYMVNGFGVGLTQIANQVNNVNNKSTFTSAVDHFSSLFSGIGKLMKEYKNPLKALKEGKPIIGLAGGLAALTGSSLWAATGDEKSAAIVRDGGGGALDVEQISKHQFKYKRWSYIKSGGYYIIGTVFDLLSKFVKPLEPFFRPLCFLFDGLGRYHQGVSEHKHEMSNGHLSKEELNEIEQKGDKVSYFTLAGGFLKNFFSNGKKAASIIANARHSGELASAAA